MWGFCESQETVGVSPEMVGEFVVPYQKPIMERFGLSCYGCCEPLDPRWYLLKDIKGLTRVSVSPWADVNRMAEYLGKEFVYSRKPSPKNASPALESETSTNRCIGKVASAPYQGLSGAWAISRSTTSKALSAAQLFALVRPVGRTTRRR